MALPQLNEATSLKHLAQILKTRIERYPTNYLDLLLLENKNKTLSEIRDEFQHYPQKNNDFKTISRIKSHIRHRQIHHGWVYKSDDNPDSVIRLTGLKNSVTKKETF